MDCLTSLLDFRQKMDDIVSSIVLFIPFANNRHCDVTEVPMTSQRKCPVGMDTVNSSIATKDKETKLYGKTKQTDVDDSNCKNSKTKNLKAPKDLLRHFQVSMGEKKTAIPTDLWIEKDYQSKYGIIALKISPEEVKMTKELANLYRQSFKRSNEAKIVINFKNSAVVEDNHRQSQNASEIAAKSDTKFPQTSSMSSWTSWMAPLDVIVHMLPSSVFGESRHFHQVTAVCRGHFLDWLIKSLPISPFGEVREQRPVKQKRQNRERRFADKRPLPRSRQDGKDTVVTSDICDDNQNKRKQLKLIEYSSKRTVRNLDFITDAQDININENLVKY